MPEHSFRFVAVRCIPYYTYIARAEPCTRILSVDRDTKGVLYCQRDSIRSCGLARDALILPDTVGGRGSSGGSYGGCNVLCREAHLDVVN